MKTATIRDLRNNFAQLSAWIDDGETIEITKRGVSYVQVVPTKKRTIKRRPDFHERAVRGSKGKVINTEKILQMNKGKY